MKELGREIRLLFLFGGDKEKGTRRREETRQVNKEYRLDNIIG